MHIAACFAASLDGKINPAGAQGDIRIGSDADQQHLREIRDAYDAVLIGGETFRVYPKYHRTAQGKKNLAHCILTSGGEGIHEKIPPASPLFQAAVPPSLFMFTRNPVSLERQSAYPPSLQWVVTGSGEAREQTAVILEALARSGVESLLIEGGGEIFSLFLKAKVVQQLYLTICPLLLGGKNASSLVGGEGFTVQTAPKTRINSIKQLENELFLDVEILYPV